MTTATATRTISPAQHSKWAQVGDFVETDTGPRCPKVRVKIADEQQRKYVDGLIKSGHWERTSNDTIGIVEADSDH
ncbi:MAG: hypothetical protein AAF664_12875 [Planctomycetota bacterium]